MANRYWVGGTASWNGTAGTKWALTSGGAGGEAEPTASDDVFFDGASGAVTVTVATSTRPCNNLDFTGFTGTFAGSTGLTISGSVTYAAGMTRTHTGSITYNATATGKTLTFNGKTTASTTTFNGVGGGWTVQDAWNNGTSNITLTAGSLSTNGQTITCGSFSSSNSNTRTLTLGASTINCQAFNVGTITGLTFSGASSTINIADTTNNSLTSGGLTFGTVTIAPTASDSFSITGVNTFATLTVTGGAFPYQSLGLDDNQTITGTLTLNGNSQSNRLSVRSTKTGLAQASLSAATVVLNNVDFENVTAAGASSPWTGGTSVGNYGGNNNITFTAAVTRYWVGNGGSWSNTARWSATSGGASGATIPLPQDTVVFDANSITSASQTITVDTRAMGKDINFTGTLNTPTLAFGATETRVVVDSLTLIAGMALSGTTADLRFAGEGAGTLTSAGLTMPIGIYIYKYASSTLTLGDAFVNADDIWLQKGGFDANNKNVTCDNFSTNNGIGTSTSTLTMGSGTWTLTGTGLGFWIIGSGSVTINAGTSTVKFTDTSASGVEFDGGSSKTYNNLWFARGASTGNNDVDGTGCTFNDIKDDGSAAHSLRFTAGITINLTTFTVSGTAGNVITINSTTTAVHTLKKNGGGTINRDYLNIQHSIASPAITWYAGANSTDNQGVATAGRGWIFTAAPTGVQPTFFPFFAKNS